LYRHHGHDDDDNDDVRPGADPGVQAVSPQVTVSHPPGGRLPLLSARLAVTSPAIRRALAEVCTVPVLLVSSVLPE